jgi:hypothetical protein
LFHDLRNVLDADYGTALLTELAEVRLRMMTTIAMAIAAIPRTTTIG